VCCLFALRVFMGRVLRGLRQGPQAKYSCGVHRGIAVLVAASTSGVAVLGLTGCAGTPPGSDVAVLETKSQSFATTMTASANATATIPSMASPGEAIEAVPERTASASQESPALSPQPKSAKPSPEPTKEPAAQCDIDYEGGCVPVVAYDLDCGDIRFRVIVVGLDVHRFDADGDRVGCESYG
jgi:hypothetical protein